MTDSLVIPNHISIIMDGNRRWAKKRGMPTQFGHSEGANNLEKIANECERLGVKYLTVYAFSTENWKREKSEVDYLMDLLADNISNFDKKFKSKNVRIRLVGDINGLPEKLKNGIIKIEERTKDMTGLTVNIAINYGGRAEIIHAVKEILKENENNKINIEDINEEYINKFLYTKDSPEPDLMIRTGGELRSSGFLIWQSAYTEYYFTDVLWPDFDEKELQKAIYEFNLRKRNFGK